MARDVTLRTTWHDLIGDETYELWLKHELEAWVLEDAGDVAPDEYNQQEFIVPTLTEGDQYVAQLRAKREGRYRAGYLTANPDSWPGQSRVEFVPGALEGVGAPTINSAVWSRTSSTSQRITLSIDADDLDKDMKVYRDGVLITTIAAPHTNPVAYVDVDPPIAANHVYRARHTSGVLDGAFSDPVECFAGPLPPTDVEQSSDPTDFGSYEITWDSGGEPTRIADDFACFGTFVNQSLETVPPYERFTELTPLGMGETSQQALFTARVRREVTSFTVTDVSDWVTTPIECGIRSDNPVYNSCP